jgi:signal transduction histidine kinase
VTGKDFFRSLVRSLSQALGVRYAFISECMDAPPTRVHSFAFWEGNDFQEYLNLSIDEADRLERLLSQILLYSRPQTLDRSQIELNSFITETLNVLKTIPVAAGKYLNFVANIAPVNISVDRDKLKQVLINLVTNACEAVSIGDPIAISLQQSGNRRICISIHNGGTPIPADILPQLTKPFFTTKASGTGLGLALAEPTGGNRQADYRSSRWRVWDRVGRGGFDR